MPVNVNPAVVLFDANGVEMNVTNGVAVPVGQKALLIAGSDGANVRHALAHTDGALKTITRGGEKGTTVAADVTSTASGVNRQILDVAIYDAAGNQITSFGGGGGGQQYADGAVRGTATGTLAMVDDGTNIQSMFGDVAGRPKMDLDRWFGSALPTVGQKPMASSIPVVFSSDQTAVPVTFTPAGSSRTGVVSSIRTLGGGTAGTFQVMRTTTYTEPGAGAQRSISSSSASDTAAGVGARTLLITYYDDTGLGPFTETKILNGVTPVNTTATNIRFIESMEILTTGSSLANVGTITLFGASGGGGGTVGTIGIGNIMTAVGDNRTLWAHHYVSAGYTASLATFVVSAQSGGSGTSARFLIRSIAVLQLDAAEVTIVGDVLLIQGAFTRSFDFNPKIAGFARLTAYCIPSVNNAVLAAAFDYSEVPT